jgi:putative FmdB family regulatory protein
VPTYQYACTACGDQLEAVQSFTDPALTECPACGGALRKVFSAVGVVFKGSGFYKTDSRKAPAGEKKSDGAKADSGTSDGAKSDSGKSGSGKSDGSKSDSGSSGAKSDSAKPAASSTATPAAKTA